MAKRSRSSGPARSARERPGSPRARLFLALEPYAADRYALALWRDRAIAGRDDLRPVAEESLHLTLVFLGYHPETEIPRIADVAFDAIGCPPAVPLEPAGVRAVPPRGPRLFALDLTDPAGAAAAIQAAVSAALARERLYEPEKRPWWPHITLARVKRGARAAPLEADPPAAPIEAGAVTLYRSLLSPRGATYEAQARLDLAEPPG